MGGVEFFPVKQGEDEYLRGGAKVKIRGAKKRVNRLIQKFNKSA